MPLTATEVKQANSKEKPYKLADGGKEKTLALGVYAEVSLKSARQQHQQARDKLAQGIDPGELHKVGKLTRLLFP